MIIKSIVKNLGLIIACSLIGLFFQPQEGKVFARTQYGAKGDAYQVIALVNQVRAGYGLPPYTANGALMSAAQAHSNYQASIGSASHTGKGGSRPGDRAVAAGYGGGAKVYVSENIYSGRGASASTAVNWWQNDAVHLNTMISPSYTDIGVGVAEGNGVLYYTMDVGYVSGAPGDNSNAKDSSGGGKSPKAAATSAGSVIIPIIAATPQTDGSIIHTVQSGQALWNIAAIYNISIADLLALNGLSESSFIHPGDKMLIRPAANITSTVTETTTQTISETAAVTPMTMIETATAVLIVANTATSIPQLNPSDTPVTTNTIAVQSSLAPTKKIDPVLLIIVGLIIVGIILIIFGSIAHRTD